MRHLSKKIKMIIGWSTLVVVILLSILITLGVHGFNVAGITFYFEVVLTRNFLSIPSILLALLTFIGYLVMGRGIRDSFLGAIKTAIGLLLLSIGSGALVGLATPIFRGLRGLSDSANIVPLDPYFGLTSVNNFLSSALGPSSFVAWVSYAFIIGLAVNIVLVLLKRWTNVHSLMVTGHVMIQQASIMTAAVYFILFRKIPFVSQAPVVANQVLTWIVSGVLIGFYWAFATNGTIKATQKVTENSNFAIGHQQMLAVSVVYKLSRFFSKNSQNAEERHLSPKLKIFEDNIFTQTLIVTLLFLTLIFILQFATTAGFVPGRSVDLISPNGGTIIDPGGGNVQLNFGPWQVQGGAHWFINALLGSLKVIASVIAIVTGVRMFVTELQQSFQGISEKIIPGTMVAVDIAAVYGFSPNAITYAFFSGTAAQFVAVGILVGLTSAGAPVTIVIPLFITLFFNSGALGAFANACGGYKAAIIVPAIFGFLEIIIIGFAMQVINGAAALGSVNPGLGINRSPYTQGYIGLADWNFFFGIAILATGANNIAGWIIFALVIVLLVLYGQFTDSTIQKRDSFLQKLFKVQTSLTKTSKKPKELIEPQKV